MKLDARLVSVGLAAGLALCVTPARAGEYWLSAEIEGAANTRSAAVVAMAPAGAESPDTPPPLAGHVVGKVADLPAALAWVDRWAFSGATLPTHDVRDLSLGPAPVPGGELVSSFGTFLQALVIDEVDEDGGTRGFRWPTPAPDLPERWVPAAVMSQRAPLFAAPSPILPPFAESHDTVLRSDDVYYLGVVDRCEASSGLRRCLRWAQVLVHGHGRWRGGYLPAAQIATIDGWVRAPAGLPRVHAIRAATAGDDALFVLLIRTKDYDLHRTVIRLPLVGDAFPEIDVTLEGAEAVITSAGEEVARRSLTASVDARH